MLMDINLPRCCSCVLGWFTGQKNVAKQMALSVFSLALPFIRLMGMPLTILNYSFVSSSAIFYPILSSRAYTLLPLFFTNLCLVCRTMTLILIIIRAISAEWNFFDDEISYVDIPGLLHCFSAVHALILMVTDINSPTDFSVSTEL